MQSYIFDFEESPSFWRKWNKEFDVENLSPNSFNIVLVDDVCEDNIEECIDANGELIFDNSHTLSEACSLTYSDMDTVYLSLDGDVVFTLNDDVFSMKGAFITNSSGYVMGYSINSFGINLSNSVTFEDGLILWSIVESETHG